jgi:hypothetical protein
MSILTITLDTKPVIAKVRGIADKQIPFATALALTRTAQDAQAEIRRQMPQRFTVRNNWIQKGVIIRKATKQDLAALVIDRDDFMTIQETGGTKTPRGRSVAVPQAVRVNKRGIVPRTQRPSALVGKPNIFRAVIRGVDGLWQRVGPKGRGIKLLYVLKPSVPIKPRFGFFETVRGVAVDRFTTQFELAFAHAVRTAR